MPAERPARLTDDEYLRHIESLAQDVASRAFDEGWLTYLPDDEDQTPLQRSMNEMARNLRHLHYDGDECLDDMDNETS